MGSSFGGALTDGPTFITSSRSCSMGVSSTCMSSLNSEFSILSWCVKCAFKSPDVLSNTNKSPRKITTDVLVVESLEPFVIYYSFNCYDVALGQSKASCIFTLMVNQLGDKILTNNLKVRLTTGGGMIPSQSHNEIACAECPTCKSRFENRTPSYCRRERKGISEL